jgi:hypothetical protein
MPNNLVRIYEHEWELVREDFSEEEKTSLRSAMVGETVCPRCWWLNPDELSEDLKKKLQQSIGS